MRPPVVEVPVTVVEENWPEPPTNVVAAATEVKRLASVVEPSVEEPVETRFAKLLVADVAAKPSELVDTHNVEVPVDSKM